MRVEDSQIKDFIIDAGLISRSEAEETEKEARQKRRPLSELLVSKGKFSEDDLRRVQAYILGIPFVNLKGQTLDKDTLNIIPEPIARKHNVVAFQKNGGSLEVALLNIEDLSAAEPIKSKIGFKILPRLTDSESMREAIIQYQRNLKDDFGDIIKNESENIKIIAGKLQAEGVSSEELEKMAGETPVVKILDTLLKHAVIQNASDIHLEPLEDQVLVRYRVGGVLHDAMILPKYAGLSLIVRLKSLSGVKLSEKTLPQDGRFKIDMNGEKISFRVSTLPVYHGEKITMRLLREAVSGFTLESLGFHGEGFDVLHKALRHAAGLIVVAGPSRSGKSTTLYTMLDILNSPQVDISTIEDPIEFQMNRVNQTQIKPEVGLTFSAGLRNLIRQDPDIIMVGEIRDAETASLSVNAAIMGHLVLSGLHAVSAAEAVCKLTHMKIPPFLLVSVLNTVVAQRLVRRLRDKREKYYLSPAEIDSLEKALDMDRVLKALRQEKIVGNKDDWENIPFYKVPKEGGDESFEGRLGIYEVFNISGAVKDLILKGATAEDLELQAKREGMLTLMEDGLFKAAQGLTTIEEVLRIMSE